MIVSGHIVSAVLTRYSIHTLMHSVLTCYLVVHCSWPQTNNSRLACVYLQAEKLSEKLSLPMEVPIVPLGLQHRLAQQPTASFHFDHVMVSRCKIMFQRIRSICECHWQTGCFD